MAVAKQIVDRPRMEDRICMGKMLERAGQNLAAKFILENAAPVIDVVLMGREPVKSLQSEAAASQALTPRDAGAMVDFIRKLYADPELSALTQLADAGGVGWSRAVLAFVLETFRQLKTSIPRADKKRDEAYDVVANPYLLVQVYADGIDMPPKLRQAEDFFRDVRALAEAAPTMSPAQRSNMELYAAAVLTALDLSSQGSTRMKVLKTNGDIYVAADQGILLRKTIQLLTTVGARPDTRGLAKHVLDALSNLSSNADLVLDQCGTTFLPDFLLTEVQAGGGAKWRNFALAGFYWREYWTKLAAVARLTSGLFPLPDGWDGALDEYRIATPAGPVPLTDEQKLALTAIWREPLTVLLGPPGSGKTTLFEALEFLAERFGAGPRAYAAFTNKATQVLRDHGLPAKTLHKTLKLYGYLATPPKDADEEMAERLGNGWLVVDEMSMLDVRLLYAVLRCSVRRVPAADGGRRGEYEAAPFRVVLAGDLGQLPPVMPGNPADLALGLNDKKAPEGRVPVVRLTRILHTDNPRITAAIKAVEPYRKAAPSWPEWGEGLPRIESGSWDDMLAALAALTPENTDDWQIITPTNALVLALNKACRNKFRPAGHAADLWCRGDRVYLNGALPDDDVVKGAYGRIVDVGADGSLLVDFSACGGPADKLVDRNAPLKPGWAVTVHKAQGSRWDKVLLVVPPRDLDGLTDELATVDPEEPVAIDVDEAALRHSPWIGVFDKRLIYTAVSRARRDLCILAGRPDEFVGHLGSLRMIPRDTRLRGMLRFGLPWRDNLDSGPKRRQ